MAIRQFKQVAADLGVPVQSVVLRFDLASALDPPLSWMLTDPQKTAVDQGVGAGWRTWSTRPGCWGPIDAWFPLAGSALFRLPPVPGR